MTERSLGAVVEDEVIDLAVDQLRKNVDTLDDAIVSLLQERQKYSAGIRRYKRRQDKPAIDLSREREVVGHYVAELGSEIGYEVANAVLHYSKKDIG